MKLTTIGLFLIQCVTGLFLIAWQLLVLFIELIDGGEHEDRQEGVVGNHMTVDGDSHTAKRAGEQYISDRENPPHERGYRH